MTDIFLIIIGFIVGYKYRDIRNGLKELQNALTSTKSSNIGATPGSYGPVNPFSSNQDGEVGISTPKTPEQMAWEADERLRQEVAHHGIHQGK